MRPVAGTGFGAPITDVAKPQWLRAGITGSISNAVDEALFKNDRDATESHTDQAEDAEHSRRAEELRLRTAVTNAYDNLVTAYRVIEAEARNQALSEEQLQLQQRRYALGAAGLLELMDAQTTVTTSDQLYLNALYDFQFNLIALEAAVGQPLPSRN